MLILSKVNRLKSPIRQPKQHWTTNTSFTRCNVSGHSLWTTSLNSVLVRKKGSSYCCFIMDSFSFPILRKGDTGITSLLSSSTINACNNNSFSAIVFWLLSFDGIFRLFISAYSSGNFSTRVYSLRRKSRKFRICSLLNLLTGNPSMPLIMRNRVSSLITTS